MNGIYEMLFAQCCNSKHRELVEISGAKNIQSYQQTAPKSDNLTYPII